MISFLKKIYRNAIKLKCKNSIKKVHNTCSGKCYIIGNGPSLKVEDLELIKNEVTFGSNRIYGIYNRTDWRPTYYASQDFAVLNEIKDNLYDLSLQSKMMFLCGNIYRNFDKKLRKSKNIRYFYVNSTKTDSNKIDSDLTKGVNNPINITYTMMEIAAYMGFNEIYLLGVDCSYGLKVNDKGETVIDNESKDSYFEGIAPIKLETKFTVTTSGLSRTKTAFQNFRTYAEQNNIIVCNCTRGGKLEVFERKNLEETI